MDSSTRLVQWKSFESHLSHCFGSLMATGDFVDVTLAASNATQMHAHRVVLAAASPYFRHIFKSTSCNHPVVILRDVDEAELKALLKFVYLGEVRIPSERMDAFIDAANSLQILGINNDQQQEIGPSSLGDEARPRKRPRLTNLDENNKDSHVNDDKDKNDKDKDEMSNNADEIKKSNNEENNSHKREKNDDSKNEDENKDNNDINEEDNDKNQEVMNHLAIRDSQKNEDDGDDNNNGDNVDMDDDKDDDNMDEDNEDEEEDAQTTGLDLRVEESRCLLQRRRPLPPPPLAGPPPLLLAADMAPPLFPANLDHLYRHPGALLGLAGSPAPSSVGSSNGNASPMAGPASKPAFPGPVNAPALSGKLEALRVRATDPRPCPKCGKIYRSAHTLRTHMEDKHTSCPGYRCALCGTVAKSRNSLHSHMSRQHRGISTKDLPVLAMPTPFDPELASRLLAKAGLNVSPKELAMKASPSAARRAAAAAAANANTTTTTNNNNSFSSVRGVGRVNRLGLPHPLGLPPFPLPATMAVNLMRGPEMPMEDRFDTRLADFMLARSKEAAVPHVGSALLDTYLQMIAAGGNEARAASLAAALHAPNVGNVGETGNDEEEQNGELGSDAEQTPSDEDDAKDDNKKSDHTTPMQEN